MNKEEALRLLAQYTKNESLVKHALSVEAAMKMYARKFGEDEEKWGIVGLLHDFDYEMFPTKEEHPFKGAEILRGIGYPEDVIYSIVSHANYSGYERKNLMDKVLYAVDELTGLITAAALVKPTRSIFDVEANSVRKKMKDKSFARSVCREDIIKGAEELNVDLIEHIDFVIKAMQGIASEINLAGNQ